MKNNIEILLNDGFIPLLDWEKKYNDKLLIWMPSSCYRKNNIIARITSNNIKYYEIASVDIDHLINYRIPNFIKIEYEK